MIDFIPYESCYKRNNHVACDDIVLPEYGIDMMYTSQASFPFIYGRIKNGDEFVLKGERGGTHSAILSDFKKELASEGIVTRFCALCCRVWDIKGASKGAPKGLLTAWVSECPEGYSSSKAVYSMCELLKEQNVDISNYSIAVESFNGLVDESYDEKPENGIYIISIRDYIAGMFDSMNEIPKEYLRQQRKQKSSGGSAKPTWHDLPYRLYRWQSDESKTIKISQQVLTEIVKKCVREVLKEIRK